METDGLPRQARDQHTRTIERKKRGCRFAHRAGSPPHGARHRGTCHVAHTTGVQRRLQRSSAELSLLQQKLANRHHQQKKRKEKTGDALPVGHLGRGPTAEVGMQRPAKNALCLNSMGSHVCPEPVLVNGRVFSTTRREKGRFSRTASAGHRACRLLDRGAGSLPTPSAAPNMLTFT